jgi:hypothetical protein
VQRTATPLRSKEIWIDGNRYRNPDEDLPVDFDQERPSYYAALKLPSIPAGMSRTTSVSLPLLMSKKKP